MTRCLADFTPCIRLRDVRHHITLGAERISIAAEGAVYHLTIVWRDQSPYGGRRPFFQCPRCDRGTSILYRNPALSCRRCSNLGYESERLSQRWRAWHRLIKLHRRAGSDVTRLPPRTAPRPKGKHRRKWAELEDRIKAADRAYAESFSRSPFGL